MLARAALRGRFSCACRYRAAAAGTDSLRVSETHPPRRKQPEASLRENAASWSGQIGAGHASGGAR